MTSHWRRWTIVACSLLFFLPALDGQVGISVKGGKALRHTERLTFDVPEFVYGLELQVPLRSRSAGQWSAYYGHPEVLLHGGWIHFNEPDVLGHAIYLVPSIRFFPWKGQWLVQPNVRLGTGLAFLNKRYDYNDNPTNNSISSVINNATTAGAGLDVSLGSGHRLGGSVELTHFSNARVKSPNYGINTLTWGLTYSYRTPGEPWELRAPEPIRRYISVEPAVMLAVRESAVPGGPLFPVYAAMVTVGFPVSDHQSVYVQPAWQYRAEDRVFGESVFAFNSEEEAASAGHKGMLGVGLESRFNRLVVSVGGGAYFFTKKFAAPFPIYNTIQLQYLIGLTEQLDLSPGLFFKSHAITAEYIGLTLGLRYKRYNLIKTK
jgi:hypothetical protein